jgi:hypothetical protein
MSSRKLINNHLNNLTDCGPKSSTMTKPKKYSQDDLFSIEDYIPQIYKKSSEQITENESHCIEINKKSDKIIKINRTKTYNYTKKLDDDLPSYSFLDSYQNSEFPLEMKKAHDRKKSYQEDFSVLKLKTETESNNTENIRNYHLYTVECLHYIKNISVPSPRSIKGLNLEGIAFII